MTYPSEARITCPPEVLSRVLDGEAVLLHLGSGVYFGMNEVATFAWEKMTKGTTYGEIRDALLAEFDVTREALEADLERFVGALVEKKLVQVSQ